MLIDLVLAEETSVVQLVGRSVCVVVVVETRRRQIHGLIGRRAEKWLSAGRGGVVKGRRGMHRFAHEQHALSTHHRMGGWKGAGLKWGKGEGLKWGRGRV